MAWRLPGRCIRRSCKPGRQKSLRSSPIILRARGVPSAPTICWKRTVICGEIRWEEIRRARWAPDSSSILEWKKGPESRLRSSPFCFAPLPSRLLAAFEGEIGGSCQRRPRESDSGGNLLAGGAIGGWSGRAGGRGVSVHQVYGRRAGLGQSGSVRGPRADVRTDRLSLKRVVVAVGVGGASRSTVGGRGSGDGESRS